MELNVKQQAFADYYVELGNAEKAALKAGYSETYARAQSYKLLANVGIKAYIDERMIEIKNERIADQQEVMEFLTAIMRGEVKESVPLMSGAGKQSLVEAVPNAQARKSAAELLGKRYAMWTDKQQLDITAPVTIVNDLDD